MPTESAIPISERAAHLARVHIGVTVPVLAITMAVFCTRFYLRLRRSWRLGWVEWFILAGFISTLFDWALLMSQMITTPGVLSLPRAENAIMLAFLAIPAWGWSMTCIKISVALNILVFKNSRPWKIFLFSIIGLQAAYGIGNTVFLFQICRPLSGWWALTPTDAYCTDSRVVRIMSTIGSFINITTDVLLSLTPITFLWTLKRPIRERILVCLLMGMGLFASISSIMKTLIVLRWSRTPDQELWAMAISIATWTVLEQLLAVIAACLPFLKPLIQRLLGTVGISLSRHDAEQSPFRMRTITVSADNKNPRDCGGTEVKSDEDVQSTSPSAC